MAADTQHSQFAVDWPTDELQTRYLSNVERTQIRWLWEGRIATGRLSLLTGHPGEGKSWASLALAAALTRGAALPGETVERPPCNVLVASAEDDPGDTIGPRFDALGGDPARLVVIDGVQTDEGERGLALPKDVAVLEAELRIAQLADRPYGLVVIDPLSAYLPASMDSHRDVSVRATLAPLSRLAAQHDVAILAVSHLTKGSRDTPALRAQGSVAFTAAVRTQLLLGRDPQDGESSPIRHLVVVKSNIGPEGLGLKFTLEGGRFGWLGTSTLTGRDLAARHGDTEAADSGAAGEAEDVLRQILADGPVSAKRALTMAADAGVSEASIRRARQALGVTTRKEGFKGGWEWVPAEGVKPQPKASSQDGSLRSGPAKAPQGVTHTQADTLGDSDALGAEEPPLPPGNGHLPPSVAATLRVFPDARLVKATPPEPVADWEPFPLEALISGPDA
ncbi:MAG: AAA family ATPase [Candidatus Dormiibacterota bacterium]